MVNDARPENDDSPHLLLGEYVATSPDFQGLVVQEGTMAETMEIARDVARKIVESFIELSDPIPPSKRRKPHNMGTSVSLVVAS